MPFNTTGGILAPPQSLTTCYLEGLLVTNPGVNEFPFVDANGQAVTRTEILNELQTRNAQFKQAGGQNNNFIVDNSPTIGAISQNAAAQIHGEDSLIPPAVPGVGGASPVTLISQIA